MTCKQHDLSKELREIITIIRSLAPSLARIKSSAASDQEAEISKCLLRLMNIRSDILESLEISENTLLNSKYRFVNNVRNVLAMALERSDVSAFRKLDALRSAIDFAEVLDDIELDFMGHLFARRRVQARNVRVLGSDGDHRADVPIERLTRLGVNRWTRGDWKINPKQTEGQPRLGDAERIHIGVPTLASHKPRRSPGPVPASPSLWAKIARRT